MVVELNIQCVTHLHDIVALGCWKLGSQRGKRDQGNLASLGGAPHYNRRQHKDQRATLQYPINSSHRFNPYDSLPLLSRYRTAPRVALLVSTMIVESSTTRPSWTQ